LITYFKKKFIQEFTLEELYSIYLDGRSFITVFAYMYCIYCAEQ